MTDNDICVTRLSAWAPGIGGREEWNEWALGKRDILPDKKGPDIAFTDSLFRRRLSQISRMTIQVIRDLLPVSEDTKIIFLSFRGEITKQFQINKTLIEEGGISPAVFSLSVFNAPVALAAMALKLKGGYCAVYPDNNSFSSGLKAAQAALLCGPAREIILVYADEKGPDEYDSLSAGNIPAAFGLLLSRNRVQDTAFKAGLSQFINEDDPLAFLKQLLLCGDIHVSP
ncbi:MAG: beta-ketoacyl synthase chain length factor [Treponema sp.]|jgi:hypothetical protein|nr:beta-ketoacyl synthase chain length factor [Treponema sp.]